MRRAGPLTTLLLLLLVPYAALSVHRVVPGDGTCVVDAPLLRLAPRRVAPGFHLVPRLVSSLACYPAMPATLRVDLSGPSAASSSEGARVDVEVELTWSVPPERVLDLHRAAGASYEAWLSELVRRGTVARLRQVSYDVIRDRDPEFQRSLQNGLAEAAGEAGVRLARLRLAPVAAPGGGSAEILRAAARPVPRQVALIGVDSFDWRVIEPLMKGGRMPNLAGLVARGARANLRTIHPILSPVIWTSIATGVKPSRHGIVDFVVAARDSGALLPVTSRMRQVPALWNLLGRQGVGVDVVAWWATWPAETVHGRIVTDRVAFQLFEDQMKEDWKSADPERARGKTYPPELFSALRPLIKAPAEIGDDEVAWFLPGARFPRDLLPEERERLDGLRTIIAAGQTYHAIALALLAHGAAAAADGPGAAREEEGRLRMFYYEGPDTTSHLFMRDRPPLLPGVARRELERFGGIVDRYYERQDRYLGEVLERLGPEATVLLVSDHGFKSGADRPPHGDPRIGKGDAAEWHTPVGVLVMAGPDVPAGVDLGAASVLDVAPTILALYGLPVARDMDGQPLTQALAPAFLAAHPVTWIDTYGGVRPPPDEAAPSGLAPSADDAALVEKLRNLGYIGEERMTAHNNRGVIALDEGDADGAIASFEKALAGGEAIGPMVRVNLARAWMKKGDLGKARDYAEQALREDPKSKQAESLLAAVAMKGKDFAAAESHLRKAIAIDPTFVQALSQLGRLYAQQKKYDAALAEYTRAVALAPLSPAEWNAIGNIERDRGRPDKAMEAYREALRCDAQYIGACNNLGLLLQEKKRLDEARALYDKALAIRPENPILRNSLGTLLDLKGDKAGALEQFQRAVRADPAWPVAQGNLATVLYQSGRFPEAKAAFGRWVALEPDSIDARLELALCLLMTQEWDGAIAQFNTILARDPQNVKAHIALGETLLRKGDLETAQAHLEEASRLAGNMPRIYNSLAEAYAKRGLTEKAAAAYRRSLALDPKQAEVRQRLAAMGG